MNTLLTPVGQMPTILPMPRSLLRLVSVGLTVCLLVLSALVYPQTVAHATHHVHHKAATHASALCTWMCAAGQGLEAIQFIWHARLSPLTVLDVLFPQDHRGMVPLSSLSRGPPSA